MRQIPLEQSEFCWHASRPLLHDAWQVPPRWPTPPPPPRQHLIPLPQVEAPMHDAPVPEAAVVLPLPLGPDIGQDVELKA